MSFGDGSGSTYRLVAGKKCLYPNEDIYLTWESYSSNIVQVSADQMASYLNGPDMTAKSKSEHCLFA